VRLRRKPWFWPILVLLLVLVATGAARVYHTALLGSGFMAKSLCSGIFVSRRDRDSLINEDMSGPGYELLVLFQTDIDRAAKQITVSMFGLGRRTAIYREGLGCTLLIDKTEAKLRAQSEGLLTSSTPASALELWPEGERVDTEALPPAIDRAKLQAAIEAAFAEPHPDHPRRTRALVVVHDGRIVAERYAPGFGASTPLLGWSMSKMAVNALTGLLVQDGCLHLADKALLPEWTHLEDPRAAITLDQLLRMTSGLAFKEDYADHASDIIQMLYVEGDQAGFAAAKPLAHPPGSYWHYSGGTSNIIARVMRPCFAHARDYLHFPRARLFAPLGMQSAVLEPDETGTFVGSTFLYASARDWARLGLLYLRDGVWQGQRLLPQGWVSYSLKPTQKAPDGEYGAHVWLKLPESVGGGDPAMPEDGYYMLGYEEQIVAVIPSRNLVIVRLGLTHNGGDWDNARDLAPIVQAFPRTELAPERNGTSDG